MTSRTLSPVESDREIRERILAMTTDKFLAHGFSRVTMDDLATELGMSKKTLYRIFPTKLDLLEAMAVQRDENILKHVAELATGPGDTIARLRQMTCYMAEQYAQIGRIYFEDMRRYAPQVWTKVEKRRKECIGFSKALIEQGIKEGVFRDDLAPELIGLIKMQISLSLLNPEFVAQAQVNPDRVFQAMIKIFYEGILSEAGRARLKAEGCPAA